MPIVKRPAPQMPTPATPPKPVDPISIEVMKAAMAERSVPEKTKSYEGSPLGAIAQTIDGYTKAQEEKKRKEMAKLLRGATPPNPWMPVVTKKG